VLSLAEVKDGQTMILAMLLVRMINWRCKRLHMELDEGVVHRDAMTGRQERPGSASREPNVHFAGLSKTVAERLISEPECSQSHLLPRFAR